LKKRWIILAAVAALSLAGCSSCSSRKGSRTVHIYHGVGVVESLDTDQKQIQINHEEIKDYMPAMSMPYRVKHKSLMDGLKAGDKIEFTIHDSGQGPVLTDIKKAESPAEGAQKAG